MGNRRMGLGRLEALLEAVDRDLNLVNSTLTNCTITTSAAATFTGTISNDYGALSISNGIGVPVSTKVDTALPANGALLVKNTFYAEDTTNGEAFLLPTVANSTVGDWIVVMDTAGIANGEAITIGSAASGGFAIGSRLTGINVLATSSTRVDLVSVAASNSVIMNGLTNGAGGKGSNVTFVFNGTAWCVKGESYNIGNGTALTVGTDAMIFAATS